MASIGGVRLTRRQALGAGASAAIGLALSGEVHAAPMQSTATWPPTGPVILGWGDSVTADLPTVGGWRSVLYSTLVSNGYTTMTAGRYISPGMAPGLGYHEGYPGLTIRQAISEIDAVLAPGVHPDIIILDFGTALLNGPDEPRQAALADMTTLVDGIRSRRPAAAILIQAPQIVSPTYRNLEPWLEAFGEGLTRVANGRGLYVGNRVIWDNLISADGVHPSPGGLVEIASSLWRPVLRVIRGDWTAPPIQPAPGPAPATGAAASINVTVDGRTYGASAVPLEPTDGGP